MNPEIEIRDFSTHDIEKLLPLINREYAVKKTYDHIFWQCFENPLPHIIKIAIINDKIIGWFGIQKRELNNGMLCGQLSFLLIVPEWRGRGLFKKLGLSILESMKDLDLLFVFANENAKIPCEKSFDMQTINSNNYYVCESFNHIPSYEFSCKNFNDFLQFTDIEFGLEDRVYFNYDLKFFKMEIFQPSFISL